MPEWSANGFLPDVVILSLRRIGAGEAEGRTGTLAHLDSSQAQNDIEGLTAC
jgi:hypothetical protein